MRLFSILSMLVLSGSATASHFISCQVLTQVTEVKDLQTLDGETTIHPSGDDKQQMVTIKVISVNGGGKRGCLSKGSEHNLYVKKDQQGEYQKGDDLVVDYQNVGDSQGRKTFWGVVEKTRLPIKAEGDKATP